MDEDKTELQDASDCMLPFRSCIILTEKEGVWPYLSQVIGIHPSSSRKSSSEQSDFAEMLRKSSLSRYGSKGISNGAGHGLPMDAQVVVWYEEERRERYRVICLARREIRR
jgi:hypothetical protein